MPLHAEGETGFYDPAAFTRPGVVRVPEDLPAPRIPLSLPVKVRRIREGAARTLLFCTAVSAVVAVFFIFLFLAMNGYPIFEQAGAWHFLAGDVWNPTGMTPSYGIFPLIAGTLLVTLGAMALAVPFGIAVAVFIAELAPPRVRAVVKPAVELLAGIPSVVYGFFGLIILTDWIRVSFDVASGETWLAGSILLGIMALPTIVSVSEDAISAVAQTYREGSLALGATHWQTIAGVVVPGALSGITAAIILGMGRAIGETMAVIMVTGNAGVLPDPLWNVLSPVRTLTGTLGIEMGEVAVGSSHYHALFGVAVVLLAITLGVNLLARQILARVGERHTATAACGVRRGRRNVAGPYAYAVAGTVALILLAAATGVLVAAVVAVLLLVAAYVRRRISPRTGQKIAFGLLYSAAGVVLFVLGVILFDIVYNGIPAISWEFLTAPPSNLGRAGGIGPAIVGTLYLVGGAILFALPVGIGAAIYLQEYIREGRITRIIRAGVDLLGGTPSIVFGLFGFAFLVLYLNLGVSLLAGQITLGLMVLPTIIRTTEEALRSVPGGIREGSLALGATPWQTIRRVVLPPAVPGILTGTILSIGRAAGETAPILFTAVVFSQRFLPTSVMEPVMALPYHLFILATSVPGARENQYGTALVLLTLVAAVYLVAIVVRNRCQQSIRW
ncbi:phosphate ABC transporter permease PstA [Methanoculleus sp. Wushi-C6]|uniref:Phosphate ABC transporter permease PstA n=1 Tax=Methanoculleus caldifontis TaxID=2651577 RepID=A0ABU3X283_9EURY|nr:phosphate ABC transporter permease PstA [Methanoculleus sp. Wushi-C6]MDV2482071.1 phosphate ABC transporter permease PstA [Methanoculleus sp. Wushi-C6]